MRLLRHDGGLQRKVPVRVLAENMELLGMTDRVVGRGCPKHARDMTRGTELQLVCQAIEIARGNRLRHQACQSRTVGLFVRSGVQRRRLSTWECCAGNIQNGTGNQDQSREEAAIHLINPCFRARFNPLSTRVCLVVFLTQVLGGDMRINLSGGDIGVPQHLLDST